MSYFQWKFEALFTSRLFLIFTCITVPSVRWCVCFMATYCHCLEYFRSVLFSIFELNISSLLEIRFSTYDRGHQFPQVFNVTYDHSVAAFY